MAADDPCISAERHYIEAAILESRDSLLGTYALSFPSFPLGFASQNRLPSAVELGSFNRGPLECLLLIENASTLQDIRDEVEKASKICKVDFDQVVVAPSFSPRTTSSSASDGETNEVTNDSAAPDDYNPLSGDSHLFYGRKCETSSRVTEVFSPEAEDDWDPQTFDMTNELPPHSSFFGTAATEGDNTTFSFAEVGLPAKQYPPSVEAYVPMAVGEFPTRGPVLEDDSPQSNNSGSPQVELATFPGHGVEWPTGVQPTLLPLGDGFLESLLERVRVIVRAKDPPSIDVVRQALEQNTTAAFYMGFSKDFWMIAVEEIWDEHGSKTRPDRDRIGRVGSVLGLPIRAGVT
ncbi:hypothetical protein Taro_034085 [Colocasia esculenta]|uniref:Uncharacterized protein n=1 Tax=Colocasia esculenta TaxID=4460 RepID=A0A843W8X7_COLES|nr:hypothetical protein [Colocasia esculenta]